MLTLPEFGGCEEHFYGSGRGSHIACLGWSDTNQISVCCTPEYLVFLLSRMQTSFRFVANNILFN
jgi:hypothetical protein